MTDANTVLRLATRRSKLALWQANHVADQLRAAGIAVELKPMTTKGDRVLDRPLLAIGGKAVFMKELEAAMLADEADFAVHSFKDVPADLSPAFSLPAILARADSTDALLVRPGTSIQSLHELPPGAIVGTSSLRRRAQVLATRPDLQISDIRGNVDSRLAKLDQGEYDALILATAGLERLGLGNRINAKLAAPWVAAAAQGAIVCQCRAGDTRTAAVLARLDDAPTRIRVELERAVVAALGGSCDVPLGVHASMEQGELLLRALVASVDGQRVLRAEHRADRQQAQAAVASVVQQLQAQGAETVLAAARA